MIRAASIQSQDDDPLTLALRPSLSETESIRRLRIQTEAEQKYVSDTIDEEISRDRERLRKSKFDVTVRIAILHWSHLMLPSIASTLGTSRVRKEHPPKAVPVDVQAAEHRSRTHVLANSQYVNQVTCVVSNSFRI